MKAEWQRANSLRVVFSFFIFPFDSVFICDKDFENEFDFTVFDCFALCGISTNSQIQFFILYINLYTLQTIKCSVFFFVFASKSIRVQKKFVRHFKSDAQSKWRREHRLKVHHQNAVKVFRKHDKRKKKYKMKTFVLAIAFDASFKIITGHRYVNGFQLRPKTDTKRKKKIMRRRWKLPNETIWANDWKTDH